MRPSILLLDDDASFLRACDASLSRHYNIAVAQTPGEAEALLATRRFAALIVDYWLGHETADRFLDVFDQIAAPRPPVIIISGGANRDVAIKLLNRQVFGLLEKPVEFESLRATLQRAVPLAQTLEIDLSRRIVRFHGSESHLTPSEIKILMMLADANGATVSREQFIRTLWGRTTVSRSALDTHILNLKKKVSILEPFLECVYGAGYLLNRGELELRFVNPMRPSQS